MREYCCKSNNIHYVARATIDKPMPKLIDAKTVKQHLEDSHPFFLVEALPEKYYLDGHLPGALNLPHEPRRRDRGLLREPRLLKLFVFGPATRESRLSKRSCV
jgi:3-mercaptopyruvate sulfurtransferase SseA